MAFSQAFVFSAPNTKASSTWVEPPVYFLLYFLTVYSLPSAFAKFPPNLDSTMKSAPFAHLLKKRSTNFMRYGFAVCELPLYEICSQNVSRIQCSVLGCCFHKQICYKKAVPAYMQVFIILILLIMGVFILFVFHCFLVEKRRRKNMSRQKNASELYPTAIDFNEEGKEQQQERKNSSDSKSETQAAGEDG